MINPDGFILIIAINTFWRGVFWIFQPF
ncbi:MAG: hypothetical protein GY705_02575 [Bacteroidetes bacterium]|nr:hypothetical protein [Bacteroidota bacterium]